jgi:hypothetical protein
MNHKQMREELRNAGKHVPRSNKETETAYSKLIGIEEPEVEVYEAESVDEVWTYIGSGHQPPQIINFMGRESFTRGVAKKVTDSKVLAELSKNGNKSFVAGKVDSETLIKQDEDADRLYQQRVREDQVIQNKMKAFR